MKNDLPLSGLLVELGDAKRIPLRGHAMNLGLLLASGSLSMAFAAAAIVGAYKVGSIPYVESTLTSAGRLITRQPDFNFVLPSSESEAIAAVKRGAAIRASTQEKPGTSGWPYYRPVEGESGA